MDIYEALRKDHRQFESILDRLSEASQSGSDQWKGLLDELRDGLIPHAHAEEAVFYNALRETDQAKGAVAHSYAEHAMAETELRTLEGMKKIDTTSKALIEKLRKDLKHHIEEEEGRVFSSARQVFSDEEAQQIGAAFERLKPEMKKDAESMVASTMDLISNLLPRRLVEGFRKNFGGKKKMAA
jgi:hemerythrin-like domain-containing protein